MDLAVQDQRLRPRPPAADGEAPDRGHALVRLVQAGEQRDGREAEGVDEEGDEIRLVELGNAHHGDLAARGHGGRVEELHVRVRERGRPDRDAGALLELAAARHHPLGHAPEQMPRRELLANGLRRRGRLVEVGRGEEDEGEIDIGRPEAAAAGFARRLDRGAHGRSRRGETRPDPAGERLAPHASQSTSGPGARRAAARRH